MLTKSKETTGNELDLYKLPKQIAISKNGLKIRQIVTEISLVVLANNFLTGTGVMVMAVSITPPNFGSRLFQHL